MSLSRHAVRKKLKESLKVNFLNPQVGLVFILMAGLIASAFAVVIDKFEYRQAMIGEQKAQQENERLRVEWTQILLEHSTLASPNRVEQVATKELGMITPTAETIQVIKE